MKIHDFKNIETIIFDLGGVLLDIDIALMLNEFSKYNKISQTDVYEKDIIKWNNLLETGSISVVDFRTNIKEKFMFSISDKEFDYCWNKMLLTIPDVRIKILRMLKQKYKLILISNTNKIHVGFFEKQKYWDNNYFHKLYYSHVVGLRKPDKRIFEKVIIENNLIPDKTFFFDDKEENLEIAKNIGIKTLLIGKIKIEDIF